METKSGGNTQNDRTDSKTLEACVRYFQERPVYRRLFEGFQEKYAGLGHFGGSVTLTGLSAGDLQQLGGFLQKDYAERRSVTISAALLEKALSSSRFAGLSWVQILEAYFGEPLTVKREQKQSEAEERARFFRSMLESDAAQKEMNPEGQAWLSNLLEHHTDGYGILMQQYRDNPQKLGRTMEQVLRAIAALPAFLPEPRRELLPVFAAEVTGDPHYFDPNTAGERLLYSFLKSRFPAEKEGCSETEYRNRLYYEAGLLRDELSNDVTVYGIRAWRRDHSLHTGIEGFYQCQEPMKLTLRTLGGLGTAEPGHPEDRRVYVVENPAVFSYLAARHPDRALICGNGQLKLSVLLLMDLLAENSLFYYAGDYDPEGLLIAQRLKQRYAEHLQLWQYDPRWYERYHSEVTLSEARLKKLDRICVPELQGVAQAIRRTKKAAYQEAMLSVYA